MKIDLLTNIEFEIVELRTVPRGVAPRKGKCFLDAMAVIGLSLTGKYSSFKVVP